MKKQITPGDQSVIHCPNTLEPLKVVHTFCVKHLQLKLRVYIIIDTNLFYHYGGLLSIIISIAVVHRVKMIVSKQLRKYSNCK